MTGTALYPSRLTAADLAAAVRSGRELARVMRGVSAAYAAVFTLLGLVLLSAIVALGLSPLVLPFAGGFMLVGPVLLTGYFELARLHARGTDPRLGDAFAAFAAAPAGLWLIALICAFLFLIWITDAGVLYSFTLGSTQFSYDLAWLPNQADAVLAYELWGSLMGSLLAYMIFTISAFSVPLIYERRAGLVQAISASARAVLRNFLVCLAWGLLLGAVIVGSILLLPLLLITLPVMSYASFALYRRAFPTLAEAAVEPD